MNSKQILISLGVGIPILLAIFFYQPKNKGESKDDVKKNIHSEVNQHKTSDSLPEQLSQTSQYPDFSDVIVEEERVVTNPKNKDPRYVEDNWIEINPTPVLDEIRPKSEAIESIKAIEFSNINEFRALNQGDKASLTLPDNSNIEIEVESNEFQNEGNRTWSGSFLIEDHSFPVTFTFGKEAIFGFIGHPNGQIKVEGTGKSAWLYEVPHSHKPH